MTWPPKSACLHFTCGLQALEYLEDLRELQDQSVQRTPFNISHAQVGQDSDQQQYAVNRIRGFSLSGWTSVIQEQLQQWTSKFLNPCMKEH